MKKITYNDVLARLGFFRNKKKLSARETSFLLDRSELYVTRLENNTNELKVSTLLKLLDIYEISVFDFFYLGKEYNEESKNILELYANLKPEDQKSVLDLMKRLQR